MFPWGNNPEDQNPYHGHRVVRCLMHGEIQELGLFCCQAYVSNQVSFVVSTLSR
jgi:hypothetical protein